MSSPAPLPATSGPSNSPMGFAIGIFVIGIVIGGVVLVVGLAGAFPGSIPGMVPGTGNHPEPLTACEGGDQRGNFTFSIVAGRNGGLWFNGSRPGPCIAVAAGSAITIQFSVAANAGTNHTWVLVNASNASTAVSPPAIPGAGFTGAQRFQGIAPGANVTFRFNVETAASYQYICEMPGHYAAGMWGWFNVTATPATGSVVGSTPHPLAAPEVGTPRSNSLG
jgi:plastocyanin